MRSFGAKSGLADCFRDAVAPLPRSVKKALFVCFDAAALMFLLWFSFSLRLNQPFVPDLEQALLMLAAPVIALPIFVRMGLYRSVLRYLPERAIWTIFKAVTLSILIWLGLVFCVNAIDDDVIPERVAFSFWLMSIVVISGSRFGAKWMLWDDRQRSQTGGRLIYGTGKAARQLAAALISANDRPVVGFISENPKLQGMDMLGLRVYPSEGLEKLVANVGVDELIMTSPSPNGVQQRSLVARFATLPVKVRTLPAIADLAAGKYLINDIRDVDIDDLLRRSPVPADPDLMSRCIEGRVILITGAAGSIGASLTRTVARLNPARLVLMDLNEFGLYEIGREIGKTGRFPVELVLGSVTDAALARRILRGHKVETVYHCAAFKHVSLVEANCIQGVCNNVLGTWAIAGAAHECGVENFILISSDKAVRPTNVMGATKRWAELIVHHFASQQGDGASRNFASVRFGNVIGSRGSVVPLFKEQIAAGGPVTLTDERMTRYFMSVREAAELIIQASALSNSGDILLLEMGEPVRIRDLAEDMISLAGLTIRSEQHPEGDIEIVTIGAREGEKLHEELVYDPAGLGVTSHPKILKAKRMGAGKAAIPVMLTDISECLEAGDEAGVRQVLFDRVIR